MQLDLLASKPPSEFRICGAAGPVKILAEDAAAGNKLPTFEMHAYTGAPMRVEGFYYPVVVDLEGVRVPAQERPIFRQHDPQKIVGHTNQVRVDESGIWAKGVMSGVGPDTTEIVGLAKNDFPWQASIGASTVRLETVEPGQTAEVNGREVTGPCYISRETVLGEISFVPLGADGETSATVQASLRKGRPMNVKAMLKASGKFSDEEIEKMSEEEAKAALKKCMKADGDVDKDAEPEKKAKAADDDKDKVDGDDEPEKKAKAKGGVDFTAELNAALAQQRREAKAEIERQDAIKARVGSYGVTTAKVDGKDVNLAAHAIGAGWT